MKTYMKPSTLKKLKEIYEELTQISCLYLEETDELIESYNRAKLEPENLTKSTDGNSTMDSEHSEGSDAELYYESEDEMESEGIMD